MSIVTCASLFSSRPEEKRSEIEEKTYDFLEKHCIEFVRIDHNPAETIDSCHDIEHYIGANICKNLFLKNSAKTQFYLLLMSGNTKFDSKVISHQIGSTRLSFASESDMVEKLAIHPGSVSVMGLINDRECVVKLLIDSSLLQEEYFCCHPCKNTSTLKFRTDDIINKFLPATEHSFTVVHL